MINRAMEILPVQNWNQCNGKKFTSVAKTGMDEIGRNSKGDVSFGNRSDGTMRYRLITGPVR